MADEPDKAKKPDQWVTVPPKEDHWVCWAPVVHMTEEEVKRIYPDAS